MSRYQATAMEAATVLATAPATATSRTIVSAKGTTTTTGHASVSVTADATTTVPTVPPSPIEYTKWTRPDQELIEINENCFN